MSLDDLLDNTDRSSKQIVMYDKMYQIILQITLNATRLVTPFMLLSQSPNLSQFCSKASCFCAIVLFGTSAMYNPKMTSNTKKSKVSHIQVATTCESIFTLFHSMACHCLQAILRQVYQMTLNTKRSKVLHIHVQLHPSQKFHSISLYSQPFSSYRPF